ncbi:sensor histidine kinase [Methylovulum psychrotolerans]|uniref:histidine kinase n=1 Tax=Methylovulum psychrotolerans TaxID=1704499 RepID=A0A1Z4C0Y8_9GAMM|nr:sensor histidine kinase [Methylovulum psychrotolerans]ASF47196.1 histidine kinase [Methylovulum psychrotolerans]
MFRLRLLVAISLSFCFVLLLGTVLYWGSNQVGLYFQRSQTAYQAFDDYGRLSQEAYRYFKQRMDSLLTDSPATEAGIKTSKQRLYEAMDKLRNTAIQTPASDVAPGGEQDKPAELERVAHFTAFLEASEYRFDEIERLRQQGKRSLAVQAFAQFSEQEIDGKFQPLIDVAINAERAKAQTAKAELDKLVGLSRRIAVMAAVTAALFSLTAGILLLRSVRKPIEALMKGTDEIASGNLPYRIQLNTHDEFAYLAMHFNQMAEEIALQQNKLREGRVLLEKKVAERTLELHELNGQLQHMDSTRREFLADISHELRTPITVIRGEAEVTLRGDDRPAEEYKEALHRIVELAMQLAKYVNDLLFLARAETAHLHFEWDHVNLLELVASAVEDFQVMAQENALTVALNTLGEALWVRGDKQRLRQVLFILGDNACRYSKPGGHIAVCLAADGHQAIISLSDQGIGIPAQDLERIFDRHFRSNNALSSRNDGSGLGLPMAKAILQAHGGQVSVASTEQQGSTFTVTLPLISIGQDNFVNEREIL